MKKYLIVIVLVVSFALSGCSDSSSKEYTIINVGKEDEINYISIGSIEVSDEVYTLYAMERSDGELIPQTLAVCYYTDENKVEYKTPCSTTTPILYKGRFYHCLELLESKQLTILDLEEIGLSLEVVDD